MKRLGFILAILILSLTAAASGLVIDDFEAEEARQVTGMHLGAETKFEISSEQVKTGSAAGKLTYSMPKHPTQTYNNVQLMIKKKVSAHFGKIGLWVYGNNSGNDLMLRVIDRRGEYYQYFLGNLNWGPSWQWKEVDLAKAQTHWGGNTDPTIHGPIEIYSILIGGPPFTEPGISHAIYLDDLQYLPVGAGSIKGQVVDNFSGLPVADARVYIKDQPYTGVRTDLEGNYQFFVEAGVHELVVSKRGIEEKYLSGIEVPQDQEVIVKIPVEVSPDLGVYSDYAQGQEDGLYLLDNGHAAESWNGEIVAIGGRRAIRLNRNWERYAYFDVDDDYIWGGINDVYVTVEYYDLGTGTIGLLYDAPDKVGKLAGEIMRRDTRTWRNHTFRLQDAIFANRNGNIQGDFRLGIWTSVSGLQPDAYLGRVSVTRVGKILSFDVSPRAIASKNDQNVQISYQLSALATVSVWVEDMKGNKVATIAQEFEETTHGSGNWSGKTDSGQYLPDGTYQIKIRTHGASWSQNHILVAYVEIDNSSPDAPVLVGPPTIALNKLQLQLQGKATAGSIVNIYQDGIKIAQSQADAMGSFTAVVDLINPQPQMEITVTAINPIGTESAHSAPLAITYDPLASIGQVTVQPRVFNPQKTPTQVGFYLNGEAAVKILVRDSKKRMIIQLADESFTGDVTIPWDGTDGTNIVADGVYTVEVVGTDFVGETTVTIDSAQPRIPLLLLPAKESKLETNKVHFCWEGDQQTSLFKLKLWKDNDEDLLFTVYGKDFQLPDPLAAGKWNWQVTAVDAAGNESDSLIFSFQIQQLSGDKLELRLQEGGPNPIAPNSQSYYENYYLNYSLSKAALVNIYLVNMAGNVVYKQEARILDRGDYVFSWDGRDNTGAIVNSGLYMLVITARDNENSELARERKLLGVFR